MLKMQTKTRGEQLIPREDSSSTPKELALLSLLKELQESELVPTTSISTPRLLITGFFAALSGLMYFFSARKAGVRYDENTHHNHSWFFVWFLATASGVTNIEFNWQAFIELSDADNYKTPSVNINDVVLKPLLALSAAVGMIAPFWLTASDSGYGKVVDGFINLSAALNIPVCVLGAGIILDFLNRSSVQRFVLTCQRLCASKEKREKIQRGIELTRVKDFFIAKLTQRYEDFYYGSNDNRRKFREALREGDLLTCLFLNPPADMPVQKNIIHQSSFLWYLKYFILGLICMSQNIPHAIDAYEVGDDIYPGLGYYLAGANLIPGLAFTFVGILGFGFVEVFFETWLGMAYLLGCPSASRVSQLQRLFDASVGWLVCAAFLALATVSRVFYTFSGFSGDAIGWNAWIYIHGAQYVTPMVLAVFANLGSVVVNGPFTERLIRELREKIILSCSPHEDLKLCIQTQQILGRAIAHLEKAPLETVDAFVSHPEFQQSLKNVLNDKSSGELLKDEAEKFFGGKDHVPAVFWSKEVELKSLVYNKLYP